jgi:hypothetical protein
VKKSLAAVLLVFSCSLLSAEKLADYPEIVRPSSLHIDGGLLYVIESTNEVVVYSLETHKPVHTIGKKGEGPGEFPRTPYLKILPDSLFFGTFGKFMYYSMTGELLDEKRQYALVRLLPVSDRYVSLSARNEEDTRFRMVNLLDPDQRQIKVLQENRMEQSRRRGIIYAINHYFNIDTHAGMIFVADSSLGFHISVYDTEGRKLRTIHKEREKIRISDDFKDKFLQQQMAHPRAGGEWRVVAQRFKIEYPRTFPDIRTFSVSEGRIFVRTYRQEGDAVEFIILDLEGSILHEGFFPVFEEGSLVDTYPYTFSGDSYYYLKFNGKREVWELHREVY